ncbi:MAG: chemotaxis protein CheW [Rhodospirillales bacterium]|nr:chemotaxis protein CheW [Rhodospirillales bacterium]
MNQLVPAGKRSLAEVSAETQDYVTMFIDGQMFGIPVLTVQDVLGPQKVTRIPLAPREVAGSLNLRGRIVTAIDVRRRLNLKDREGQTKPGMSVVVDMNGELYSLLIDSVGEVLSLRSAAFERNPPTLDPLWREFSAGIYRLDGKLLVVLDVGRMLDLGRSEG